MTAKKLAEIIAEEVKIAAYISPSQVELFIIQYAKQKCKEQRENCNKNQLRCFADGQPDFEMILNAPEPEFE